MPPLADTAFLKILTPVPSGIKEADIQKIDRIQHFYFLDSKKRNDHNDSYG